MSKKDRRKVLAKLWGTPSSRQFDLIDKGNEVIITSASHGMVSWWLEVFQAVFPNIKYQEKCDMIKLKPAQLVSVKLNKSTGSLQVKGKNHWPWLVENYPRMVEEGNAESELLTDSQTDMNSVTCYLQLDKDDEFVRLLFHSLMEYFMCSLQFSEYTS